MNNKKVCVNKTTVYLGFGLFILAVGFVSFSSTLINRRFTLNNRAEFSNLTSLNQKSSSLPNEFRLPSNFQFPEKTHTVFYPNNGLGKITTVNLITSPPNSASSTGASSALRYSYADTDGRSITNIHDVGFAPVYDEDQSLTILPTRLSGVVWLAYRSEDGNGTLAVKGQSIDIIPYNIPPLNGKNRFITKIIPTNSANTVIVYETDESANILNDEPSIWLATIKYNDSNKRYIHKTDLQMPGHGYTYILNVQTLVDEKTKYSWVIYEILNPSNFLTAFYGNNLSVSINDEVHPVYHFSNLGTSVNGITQLQADPFGSTVSLGIPLDSNSLRFSTWTLSNSALIPINTLTISYTSGTQITLLGALNSRSVVFKKHSPDGTSQVLSVDLSNNNTKEISPKIDSNSNVNIYASEGVVKISENNMLVIANMGTADIRMYGVGYRIYMPIIEKRTNTSPVVTATPPNIIAPNMNASEL